MLRVPRELAVSAGQRLSFSLDVLAELCSLGKVVVSAAIDVVLD